MCCAELQCPHNCAHTILEHSDTWFIARVLIPWTNRGDINAIQCIVQRRHEMWTFAHFGLNETTVLSSITWFDRIRDSGTLQFTYDRFLKWQQHDMNSHDDHPLKEHETMRINKLRNVVDMKLIYKWVMFALSKDIQVYFDEREQVGIKSNRAFKVEDEIDCGESMIVFIGDRSRHVHKIGVRWSTLLDEYFGGGPSLINHACRAHANVLIDYTNGIVVASRDIEAGDTLRVDYVEDAKILLETRGVICHECLLK